MVMGYNFFGFFTKYEATLLQEMRKRWPKYHIRRIRGVRVYDTIGGRTIRDRRVSYDLIGVRILEELVNGAYYESGTVAEQVAPISADRHGQTFVIVAKDADGTTTSRVIRAGRMIVAANDDLRSALGRLDVEIADTDYFAPLTQDFDWNDHSDDPAAEPQQTLGTWERLCQKEYEDFDTWLMFLKSGAIVRTNSVRIQLFGGSSSVPESMLFVPGATREDFGLSTEPEEDGDG